MLQSPYWAYLPSPGIRMSCDLITILWSSVQILTSVRRKPNVSVQTACVPTSGVASTANVQTRCCIYMSMTPASVRYFFCIRYRLIGLNDDCHKTFARCDKRAAVRSVLINMILGR